MESNNKILYQKICCLELLGKQHKQEEQKTVDLFLSELSNEEGFYDFLIKDNDLTANVFESTSFETKRSLTLIAAAKLCILRQKIEKIREVFKEPMLRSEDWDYIYEVCAFFKSQDLNDALDYLGGI